MTACKFACACDQHVCQDEFMLQTLFHKYSGCFRAEFIHKVVDIVVVCKVCRRCALSVHVCQILWTYPIMTTCYSRCVLWTARLLPRCPSPQECTTLQCLQGIAGSPTLLRDQCVCDSILMRPVLAPLTAGVFFVHNLLNSLPALVQTLKVRAVCQCLAAL